MQLNSERLIFTKATETDRKNYLSWYTNDTVMKYITGKGMTDEAANARFEFALETNNKFPELGFYAVNKKNDNSFVGLGKLVYYGTDQAEIGYGFMPDYWGKKFATEMLKCFIKYSKTLPKIHELIAIVDPDNIPSKKVLTNQSFTFLKKDLENERPSEYYILSLQ